MKHLNLLLLTCLSCTGLIYGMEKRGNREHDLVGFSSCPGSKPLKLTKLEGHSHEECTNCKKLDLSGKPMEIINLEDLLRIFPNLKTIKVVGCGITKIDPITTSNNTLENIDLSGNHLQKWQMSLVARAAALKYLDLSNNKINEINLRGAQKGLSLSLKNNDILFVNLHEISRGNPLAYLNLNGNNLTQASYHEMLPYVPADKGTNQLMSRVGNGIIAGAAGTLVMLLVLCYGWYREQYDRNYYGTSGTEPRDEAETGAFTIASFCAGFSATTGIYFKLNQISDKMYALQYQQWVKKIDLDNQQAGIQLLRDEEDAKK